MTIARSSGHLPTLAATLSAQHVATWVPETTAERAQIADELGNIARTIDDVPLEQWAAALSFADLLEIGDVAGTRQILYSALARAVRSTNRRCAATQP